MSVLKMVQTTFDGRKKSWKLNPGLMTFGTSRKAQVVSIDNSLASFESVIEYRDNGWHYVTFDVKNENPDMPVISGLQLKLPGSVLRFEIEKKELQLMKGFENIRLEGAETRKLVIVSHQGQLITSRIEDGNRTETPVIGWQQYEDGAYKIHTKQIHVNTPEFRETKKTEGLRPVGAVSGLTALLVGISFLIPSEKPVTVAEVKSVRSVIVRNEPRKKQTERPEKKVQAASPNAGGNKAAALMKGALGARISQLLGKVSATQARTANVIVTPNGIKAGEKESGRALAALGKVESSGRNWTGEAKGTGSGVSTAGYGGGAGAGNLKGGLGQGKTGSGNVGLIEDESEIVGGLDREVIAQYIRTQLGQILYCYERQLSANPNLYGKIAVKFTIAGSGMVEMQTINDTTLKNTSVESCILNKISKWKFPEPKGGTKVLVTYPFLFKSTI